MLRRAACSVTRSFFNSLRGPACAFVVDKGVVTMAGEKSVQMENRVRCVMTPGGPRRPPAAQTTPNRHFPPPLSLPPPPLHAALQPFEKVCFRGGHEGGCVSFACLCHSFTPLPQVCADAHATHTPPPLRPPPPSPTLVTVRAEATFSPSSPASFTQSGTMRMPWARLRVQKHLQRSTGSLPRRRTFC